MEHSGPSHHGDPDGDLGASPDQLTCRQFVELVTGYFEGTLAPRTLSLVEEHLVQCGWCTTYTEQMETTIALLRELREPTAGEAPKALPAALEERNGAGARSSGPGSPMAGSM